MELQSFRNPGKEYRGAPFWSWNDDLEEAELVRQIGEMDAQGMGGFFMHSRSGLVTPYMSNAWMDRIRACVAEARRREMGAWLYDEDKWPSGFAGGLATAPLGNEWMNGFSGADLLDHEAVRAFIDANYEPYWREVGREFGGAVPGIFTDEPNYLHGGAPRPRLPWTTRLPEVFAAERGYDLLEHLPSLFYDVGDYRAVRYDFWRTVADLFVYAYMRQIGEWCREHGLKLTGHLLLEDTLHAQMLAVGAAMPSYEHMDVPGMDHLNRNIANPLTAKQVDSAASQLGGRRTLSELYGCSGQDMSFVDRKWIGDWHLALGINLLNHHLSLDGTTQLSLRFEPAGSHLIVLDSSVSPIQVRPTKAVRQQSLSDYWEVERLDSGLA